jgi:hypothetical protein
MEPLVMTETIVQKAAPSDESPEEEPPHSRNAQTRRERKSKSQLVRLLGVLVPPEPILAIFPLLH